MSVHGERQHIPDCRFFSLRNKHNADWTDAEFAAWRWSLAEASIGGGWHVGAVCEVCFEDNFSRQRWGELRDEREAAHLEGLRDDEVLQCRRVFYNGSFYASSPSCGAEFSPVRPSGWSDAEFAAWRRGLVGEGSTMMIECPQCFSEKFPRRIAARKAAAAAVAAAAAAADSAAAAAEQGEEEKDEEDDDDDDDDGDDDGDEEEEEEEEGRSGDSGCEGGDGGPGAEEEEEEDEWDEQEVEEWDRRRTWLEDLGWSRKEAALHAVLQIWAGDDNDDDEGAEEDEEEEEGDGRSDDSGCEGGDGGGVSATDEGAARLDLVRAIQRGGSRGAELAAATAAAHALVARGMLRTEKECALACGEGLCFKKNQFDFAFFSNLEGHELDNDDELHFFLKKTLTPCLWQAPASTQRTKRKTRPAIRRSARWRVRRGTGFPPPPDTQRHHARATRCCFGTLCGASHTAATSHKPPRTRIAAS